MDESKYKFKFFLDTKELMMTVADFRRIFELPQATDNNYFGFVDAPTFSQMDSFFRNVLGFSLPLRSPPTLCQKDSHNRGMFEVDVPTTQLQPIESTQGTHKTTNASRIPNPKVAKGESSAQRKPTVIRFCVPPRRQDPETPIPTAAKIDITNLDEKIQMKIENLVEGTENVNVDEFMNDIFNDQEEPDNRIDPRSYKESPEAMKITDDLTIHNDDEEEESAEDEFELRQMEIRKG
ncbi:hypothetical protein Tco_0002327 [Tanacetum coccineum]